MLLLRRQVRQRVTIYSPLGAIEIQVLEVDAYGRVLLGFEAERVFEIMRSEVTYVPGLKL